MFMKYVYLCGRLVSKTLCNVFKKKKPVKSWAFILHQATICIHFQVCNNDKLNGTGTYKHFKWATYD